MTSVRFDVLVCPHHTSKTLTNIDISKDSHYTLSTCVAVIPTLTSSHIAVASLVYWIQMHAYPILPTNYMPMYVLVDADVK